MSFYFCKMRSLLSVGGALLSMTAASSADVCFSAFGGVHFRLSGVALSAFTGTQVFSIKGVVFGSSLSPCSKLNQWPFTGTAITTGGGKVILGFSASFADKTQGCGNVDFTARLRSSMSGGPIEFHNDRRNFSGTSTLVKEETCPALPTPPAAAFPSVAVTGITSKGSSGPDEVATPAGIPDIFGNVPK